MTPPALFDSRSASVLVPVLAHSTQIPQAYLLVLAQYLSSGTVAMVEAVVGRVVAVVAAVEVGVVVVEVVEVALPRLQLLRGSAD